MDFYPYTQSNIDIKRFVRKNKENKEGGFGRVYVVEEISSHKLYVAKVLNCRNDEQKINRELGILMICNHPTIIKFHGFSRTDIHDENNVTIILDYASNGSLQDKLEKIRDEKDFKEMTNTVRQKILIGVSRGMKYLHDRRILHRDLKPGNVLLDSDLRPLISDFGLSKFFSQDHSKSYSMFGGTLFYTAPEVISGTSCGRKSDVYSFGIMMYEIVTGEIAYPEYEKEGMNFFQFQTKVVNENLRPVFRTSVKKCIRRLIERCWSSDQSERPTFSELFNKLSRKQTKKQSKEDQEDPESQTKGTENDDNDDIDEKEEEDYFLDDVNYEEIDEYVKSITKIDDPIEELNQKNEIIETEMNELKKKNDKIKIEAEKITHEKDELATKLQQLSIVKENMINEHQRLILLNQNFDQTIHFNSQTNYNLQQKNQRLKKEFEQLIEHNKKLRNIENQNKETTDFINLEPETMISKLPGSGSFGQAFLVENPKIEEKYVTKISYQPFTDEKRILSTYMELLISAENPAILSYNDISRRKILSEYHLIVTNKFLERGTWYDFLNKSEYSSIKNSYSDTIKYINLLGISLGMRYLHDKNIIHGQLGLSNIFIDSNFYPYIGEFGLYKMIDKSSYEYRRENLIFKSPEILNYNFYSEDDTNEYKEYEIFTKSNDVYSYSMIAYCIMSGNIPMKNDSIYQMMSKIIKGEHPEITHIKNVEMRKIIEIIWSSDGKERPTFDEIVERLTDPKLFLTFDIRISDVIKYLKLFPNEQKMIQKFQIKLNPELISNDILNEDSFIKQYFGVGLIGNVCTGKTALIETYTKKVKFTDVKPTVGVKFYNDVESGIKNVYFNIIDTSGDEKYCSFIPIYLRSVSAIIFFTDVSQDKEYESLTKFFHLVYECTDKEKLVIYLATTKTDLGWKNTIDQIQLFADQYGFKLFVTSLNDIESIDTMFRCLAYDVLVKDKESGPDKIKELNDIQSNGKCLIQ